MLKVEVHIESMDCVHNSDQEVSTEEDEGNFILNPYTGIFEIKREYPDVEYLDLDNVQGRSAKEPRDETEKNFKNELKSKTNKKRLWRETNKQEWLNIYQQYMEERLKAKHACKYTRDQALSSDSRKKIIVCDNRLTESDDTINTNNKIINRNKAFTYNKVARRSSKRGRGGVREKGSIVKGTRRNTAEDNDDIIGINKSNASIEKSTRGRTINDEEFDRRDDDNVLIKLEPLSPYEVDHQEMEGVDAELKSDDNEDIECLNEELSAIDEVERARPGGPAHRGQRRGSAMAAALRAVNERRVGLLHAARAYGVRLDALCARVQHVEAFLKRKPRRRIVMKSGNLRHLRYNSYKLLKHSNMCLFNWTSEYYACFCCKQRFKHMSMLRTHAETVHRFSHVKSNILRQEAEFINADITGLECSKCHAMVDTLCELQKHLQAEHEVQFQSEDSLLVPYKLCADALDCQLCRKRFTSEDELQRHMQDHYLSHACDSCDVGFSNAKALKHHRNRRHVTSDCGVCGATFKNVLLRKSHEFQVHGVRPPPTLPRFKCPHCPERFKYDYIRLRHLIEDHKKDESEFFQCNFCPKMFLTVYWCTKHMNIVHRREISRS